MAVKVRDNGNAYNVERYKLMPEKVDEEAAEGRTCRSWGSAC
jgi:hypothetical protein